MDIIGSMIVGTTNTFCIIYPKGYIAIWFVNIKYLKGYKTENTK